MQLKRALGFAFLLPSLAFAGPPSVPMLSPEQVTQALTADYQAFVRLGRPFPHSAQASYLLRLDPKAASPAVVAATEAWLLRGYPSMEERPIEELQDGLTDPKGAKARQAVLKWLLDAPLSDLRKQHLAVTLLSRETDRECRRELFEGLLADLKQGRDFGIVEPLFERVESDALSVVEAEKFLAVRSLVGLAEQLPEPKMAETHRRLKQIASEQSSNVSEDIVRTLGASLTHSLRIQWIEEVLNSGRYPALAKIGALSLVHDDIAKSGEFNPMLETALRTAEVQNQDAVTTQEIRQLIEAHTILGDPNQDCPSQISKLRRKPR